MLELLNITIKGCGRFVEPAFISLENRPNLIQVNAENRNTGGSSGGAKTTIFKAADWLLGLCDTPTTVLKSRYSKEMEVSGQYLWDGKPLNITRSTKTGLSLEWEDQNGEMKSVSGNSVLAEEQLDAILKLPRGLFRLVSHKRQGEGGFFLAMTPKESFEFLMKALSLDEWQTKLDKIALSSTENDKLLQNAILTAQAFAGKLAEKQEELSERLGDLSMAKTNQAQSTGIDVELANREMARLQAEMSELSIKYKSDLAEFKRPQRTDFVYVPDVEVLLSIGNIEEAMEAEKTRVETENQALTEKKIKYNDVLSRIATKMSEFGHLKLRLATDRLKVTKLEGEIAHIVEGQCPTCSQVWTTKSAKQLLDKKVSDLEALKVTVATTEQDLVKEPEWAAKKIQVTEMLAALGSGSRPDLTVLTAQKKALENVLAEKKSEVEVSYNAALQDFMSNSDKVSQVFRSEETRLKAEVEDLQSVIYNEKLRSNSLSEKIKSAEKELQKTQKDLDKELVDAETRNKKVELLKHEADLAEEARRAIKSYLMTVFESALETIGSRASTILAQLPNTQTASIYFEPFKEITSGPNKGKVKEEVTPMLSVDGEEAVPVKSLSGGERASVDLAVDLAVVDLIEEQSGVGTNYLILDEPCQGMDSVGKEHYVEILKNSGTKKKILIVDHSSEIKEMVDDTILVIREGLYSRIGG